MQINDLIDRVEALEGGESLAKDLRKFVNKRKLGLVYEESKPEYVRLTNKPVIEGDLVNVLPPRGVMEDMTGDDAADEIWIVAAADGDRAHLVTLEGDETRDVAYDDLVAVARFDQTIYCGLAETGRVERGGDKPYHAVINGENYHALELLLFPYFQKVDCIYIDPPYNTGARDWKYNNNYVGADDAYRHSKWLTFMEDRLRLAKKLLNPKDSVLIVTIDEKEYLRLGLLLEQVFPEASSMQMVTDVTNPSGSSRAKTFARGGEYIFVLLFGEAGVARGYEDMLHPAPKEEPIKWEGYIRRGATRLRTNRPNMFYPIYFSTEDGSFVRFGDVVPLERDYKLEPVPDGCFAMWPVVGDEERYWRLGKESSERIYSQGYIKFGPWKKGSTKRAVYYLPEGTRNAIDSGEIVPLGRDAEGAVILPSIKRQIIPLDIWNKQSHSTADYASPLVSRILGGRQFPYPKSLYAVEDTLRFFVVDKPDALIVDFFSGSGTTAHATMCLNRRDGGRRRSISITNNEVSFEEAKAFVERGLRAGDEEWEAHGIARFITIPRITAAITGLTPEGEAIAAEYLSSETTTEYKKRTITQVDYVNFKVMRSHAKKDIAKKKKLLTMLAKGSLAQKTLDENPDFAITDESEIAVLFNDGAADDWLEALDGQAQVNKIYVITDNNALFSRLKSEIHDLLGEYEERVPVRIPMSDGFKENAVFYDLKYLEPSLVTANLAFDEIAPLLWMRAGSVGPIITLGDTDPEDATYEVTDAYGVLFDYACSPEFIEECRARNVNHIFVVTDVDRQYRDMCAEFRSKDVKQLYKSYLRSFEIGQDR